MGLDCIEFIKTTSSFNDSRFILKDLPFDEVCVRLEGIRKGNEGLSLNVSKCKYSSFLATNLKHKKNDRCYTALNPNYSNIIAISVLVKDTLGRYLLVRRSNKVMVSADVLGVSVTGSLLWSDLDKPDPIKHSVKKELLEELSLRVYDYQISICDFYISNDKLQPVFICNVIVEDLSVLLKETIKLNFENKEVFLVSDLNGVVIEGSTDTMRYHLMSWR